MADTSSARPEETDAATDAAGPAGTDRPVWAAIPRRPRRLRRGVAVLVLPLALLSFTACGAGDSKLTNADPVAASEPEADETDQADEKDEQDQGGEQDKKDEDGLWAPGEAGEKVPPGQFKKLVSTGLDATTTAHLTMESTGGVSEFRGEGDIDYTTDPPSMAMTVSVGGVSGQEIEMRLVDGSMYMKLPAGAGGAGDKFLAFDLQDPQNPFGPNFAAQTDPQAQLDVLMRGMRKIVYLGEEDGLDRYELTVKTDKVSRSLGIDASAGLPDTMTYEVSLDDEQRMRRMVMDMGGPVGRFEMRLDNYGEDVDIRKPAPGEIMETPPGALN